MTQRPPLTVGSLRAALAYISSDSRVNITLRPVGDMAQDMPVTCGYDRALGIFDMVVDLPEGVTLVQSEKAPEPVLPVAVTLERPGAAEVELLARFASIAAAEDFLATSATIDPDMLAAGNYGVDAPEDLVNPAPKPRRVWSCGWNIPGYLPDDEPMHCDTWEQARDALAEELLAASEQYAEDDVDEARMYDHVREQLNQSEPDTNFCERAGNYVWWVQNIVLPDYDSEGRTVG